MQENSIRQGLDGHSDPRMMQMMQGDSMSFRRMMLLVTRNWYYFLISFIAFIALAYFYTKNAIPVFRVSSTVLIDESTSRFGAMDNDLLEGFRVRPGALNLDNQMVILSSRSLIERALKELDFELDVYRKGWLSQSSYYPESPINIFVGMEKEVPLNVEFSLKVLDDKSLLLKSSRKSNFQIEKVISTGGWEEVGAGSIMIIPNEEVWSRLEPGDKIYFRYFNSDILVEFYRQRLLVEPATKGGSIAMLTLEGTNRRKDVAFMNKLLEVYMYDNLDKKNQEANRVIDFIDEQLVNVADSLMITENQLQEFRSRNRIMDVSAQAQQIIDQAMVLENQKAQLTLENNYYEYLDDYLSEEENHEVPISPATMDIDDPLLATLLQELAGYQAEYFSGGVGDRNPLQAQLELKIRNTKQSIKETLASIRQANSMAMEENNTQIRSLNVQASRLPVKERELLGFERKFNLNNELYTFLLQKRAESQIQKASNKPDNELIDAARSGLSPIAPNTILVYLIALVLGLGGPYGVLFLARILRNTISSEEDLKSVTRLPVVGHIPHFKGTQKKVVLEDSQSRVAESFRSLRTRMEFLTKGTTSPIILVSSTMPGEGKTFSAINLASAYSLASKKTILIGFDLRRPTMAKSFKLIQRGGLSTYLIGKDPLEKIIYPSGYPNLDIIPSGPVPPNPGELAASEKANEMFNELKERYDFIVVDSAPIGTVSDNYSLADIVDAVLVLVRHGRTNRHALQAALTDAIAHGIKALNLVVNDYNLKDGTYAYAYNYRYESRTAEGRMWRRLRRRIRNDKDHGN